MSLKMLTNLFYSTLLINRYTERLNHKSKILEDELKTLTLAKVKLKLKLKNI